jgi:hypothetical protein
VLNNLYLPVTFALFLHPLYSCMNFPSYFLTFTYSPTLQVTDEESEDIDDGGEILNEVLPPPEYDEYSYRAGGEDDDILHYDDYQEDADGYRDVSSTEQDDEEIEGGAVDQKTALSIGTLTTCALGDHSVDTRLEALCNSNDEEGCNGSICVYDVSLQNVASFHLLFLLFFYHFSCLLSYSSIF